IALHARDESTVTALAGAGTADGAGGEGGGAAGAVGAAMALNLIENRIQSNIDSSHVTSGGDIRLDATSVAHIEAAAVGISEAVAGGLAGGLALTGALSGA